MGIVSQIPASMILPAMQAASKKEALKELAAAVHAARPELDTEALYAILQEREALGSTGIGDAIALPHGKIRGLTEIVACFGRSRQGIPFDALDGKPAHLFFLLLAPETAAAPYLSALAELSRFLKNSQTRNRLMQAKGGEELLAILAEAG
ncbi:MAG: PTS sugar transporter subunit IIA [Thermodesulfobacteriota bacterium]